jgi:hypothetical protein
MDWQTVIVWTIGLAALGIAARWFYRALTGRNRSGCAACNETVCPLRNGLATNRKCKLPTDRKNPEPNAPQKTSGKRRKNSPNDF